MSWSLDPLTALSVYIGLFTGTVLLSELLRRTRLEADGSKEISRVVLGLGLSTAPVYSTEAWPVLASFALISVVMALTWSRQGLRGMHGVKSVSTGTAITPLAFLALAIGWFEHAPWMVSVAMVVATLADPAGTYIGRAIGGPPVRLWEDEKTAQGSMAVGTVAAITAGLAMVAWAPAALAQGPALAVAVVCVGVVAALAEGLSRQGSDNLSLPIGVAMVLTLVGGRASAGTLGGLAVELFVAVGFSWLAHRLRWLSVGGASATTLVLFFLIGQGGASTFAPLLVAALGGVLLSRLADRRRRERTRPQERGMVHVVSNSGAAAALAMAGLLGAHGGWYAGVVAALATASADRWATEVGRISGEWPRAVISRDRVPVGTSGGVTLYGTAGSVVGAAVVVGTAWPWLGEPQVAAMLVLVATACAFLDSVLGDTFQARYRDARGQVNETFTGRRDVVSGLAWLDNDVVNLVVTSLAGLLGVWVGIRWG